METKDLYKIAIETRNLEINLFWQRSNYFLVLNTAIAVGFFSLKNEAYALILAVVGAVVAFIRYRTTLGSKFWQSRWEERVSILEKELAKNKGNEIKIDLFSANWETIRADVKASLENNDKHETLRNFLDRQVLKKPSVSYQMTLLSLLFVVFWLVVFCISMATGDFSFLQGTQVVTSPSSAVP